MQSPLSPRIGICGSLEVADVVSGGADFLEVGVQTFLAPASEDAAPFALNLERAKNLPLPITHANMFLPGALKCVGPDAQPAALFAYAQRAFQRAQRAGIGCIVFGSGDARRVPPDWPLDRAREQFLELLKSIAPVAQDHGVTLVLEPLAPRETNFLNTLAEGVSLVAACDHPAIRLLADTFHMGHNHEGPADLRPCAKWLRHFHVAQYPSRHAPSAEGASFAPFFEVLRDIEYPGAISIESTPPVGVAEAGLALESLRADLVSVGYGARVSATV